MSITPIDMIRSLSDMYQYEITEIIKKLNENIYAAARNGKYIIIEKFPNDDNISYNYEKVIKMYSNAGYRATIELDELCKEFKLKIMW